MRIGSSGALAVDMRVICRARRVCVVECHQSQRLRERSVAAMATADAMARGPVLSVRGGHTAATI
jgi:hypothetical protein